MEEDKLLEELLSEASNFCAAEETREDIKKIKRVFSHIRKHFDSLSPEYLPSSNAGVFKLAGDLSIFNKEFYYKDQKITIKNSTISLNNHELKDVGEIKKLSQSIENAANKYLREKNKKIQEAEKKFKQEALDF